MARNSCRVPREEVVEALKHFSTTLKVDAEEIERTRR